MAKLMLHKSPVCIYLIESGDEIIEDLKPIYNIKAN